MGQEEWLGFNKLFLEPCRQKPRVRIVVEQGKGFGKLVINVMEPVIHTNEKVWISLFRRGLMKDNPFVSAEKEKEEEMGDQMGIFTWKSIFFPINDSCGKAKIFIWKFLFQRWMQHWVVKLMYPPSMGMSP